MHNVFLDLFIYMLLSLLSLYEIFDLVLFKSEAFQSGSLEDIFWYDNSRIIFSKSKKHILN